MRYKKFFISRYKALSNVEINLRNNLIPIIGINESGKSTLLHAILAFDKHNDDQLNQYHLDAKNRYDYESADHIISAHLEFNDADEIKHLQKQLSLSKTSKLIPQLQAIFQKNESLVLSRNLDTRQYDFENISCDSTVKERLVDTILSELPYILFFDDFTDRVPNVISFPKEYLNDDYDEAADSTRNEWNTYVEEIFYRATNGTLDGFIQNPNKNDRDGILSDVNDTLNEDIIQNWKKLKILTRELSQENIADLVLNLEYQPTENEHMFIFKVIDKNFKGKARYFSINERSKGFQWFFNFAIKLKYNPKYVEDFDGAIYLLDEPGSYLHSSAQEELLRSLKGISETNRVIYCTHSQYLLNPDVINISSIKIAVRKDGYIQFQNFGEYEETNKNQGSLSPVYDALKLNIAKHVFPRNEKVVITEGIVDYYVLSLLKKHMNFLSALEVHIIPGAGATNLKELISLTIAWAEKYTVILDSDEKGEESYHTYKSYFGELESSKWIMHSLPSKKNNVKIETLFSKADQQMIKTSCKTKDLKKAFSILFYSTQKNQKDIFSKLAADTLSNLKHLELEVLKKLQ